MCAVRFVISLPSNIGRKPRKEKENRYILFYSILFQKDNNGIVETGVRVLNSKKGPSSPTSTRKNFCGIKGTVAVDGFFDHSIPSKEMI
jgi:hypothetical protein